MSRSWLRVIVVLAGCAVGSLSARAATPALPIVPQMVTELYLPEEQEAAKAAYAVYAGQSEDARDRLHRDGRLPLAPARLSTPTRSLFASWFNSARWGCELPAEHLDAEAVAESTLVLTERESVAELALRSPERGIWKRLTIACTPEEAEWVRDGLPLLPHWALVSWSGGHRPPRPGKDEPGNLLEWLTRRPFYAAYAQLGAAQLRRLHRDGEITVPLSQASQRERRAIAEAVDYWRLRQNEGSGVPPGEGRPAGAVARCYGITKLVFRYSASVPGADAAAAAVGMNLPDVNPCPRPFRTVWITIDPHMPEPEARAPRWWSHQDILVAAPAALQRSLLEWRRDDDVWRERWSYTAQDGSVTYREGAPARPRHPR